MSETTEISAIERTRVGKGSARAARRAGMVPAVIYGDKKSPLSIELAARVIRKIIHEPGIFGRLLNINVDGTVSDAVGPSKLAAAAEEADGAVAIVFNGAVSDRILDIASEAAIETVVGTKEGKGFAARDDVKAWLTEKHA